jgi:L-fucose mutarotase
VRFGDLVCGAGELLKGLNPLLNPDLLYILAAMGHGDELAVVDRNFPAVSVGKRVVRLDGVNVVEACSAIVGLFPLDTFVKHPICRMEVVGDREAVPIVQTEFLKTAETLEGRSLSMGSLSREEFYERSRLAFAVISTSEQRPYGCFLLVKGVINA